MTTVEARPAQAAVGRRERPRYTRVEVLGLALAGVMLLAVAILAAVIEPETMFFFGGFALVALVGAALVWRFGTWARVLGILISLGIGFMMFWTAFGLAHPASFLDFTMGVAVPLGVLLGLGGGIAALVAGRRGRTGPSTAERGIVRGALALVGLAVVASGILSVLGRTSVDPAAAADATPVEMKNFAFEPLEIHASAEDGLLVRNGDPFMHDIAVPALDVLVKVTPGSTATVDLGGAAPGTYMVYCTLHSDTSVDDPDEAGMAARLIVE